MKRDGTLAEATFRLPAKRTSPFKSAGASVQSTSDSRGVRFSPIASPLHKLTGKNVPYVLGKEQKEAFQTLKGILCSEPLLRYPDYEQGFIVTCGANSIGIGSILSQGPLGHDLPVAYNSRIMTKGERNYAAIERELTST